MKCLPLIVAVFLVLVGLANADSDPKGADTKSFSEQIRPLLIKHCVECHGPLKPKKNLRLDQLGDDLASPAVRDKWLQLLKRIKAGEMPPEERPRPTEHEVQVLSDWINVKLKVADAKGAAEGRVVLRRLNRIEYESSIRDLLEVPVKLKEELPKDSAAEGFDTVGSALHVSSFLMEKYLEAADKALNLAVANRPKPPPASKKRYSLKDMHTVKTSTEKVYRILDDCVVCFTSSHWHSVWLSPFYPQEGGLYRFRISASGYQSGAKPVTYRVTASGGDLSGKTGLIGYYDAPADKATVVEFVRYMEPKTTVAILPYGLAGSGEVDKVGAKDWKGPGLAVQWVEVEGPLNETWPPASHRRLFGDQPQGRVPSRNVPDRVEVVSKEPLVDAQRILRPFIRRAVRRAISDDDLEPYLALFKAKMGEKNTFEQALRAAMMAVMVSPEFLFLPEKPGPLDDFSLASRLSYFLWSTMPDDELLALAEKKQLRTPAILHQQVERMLEHPKAAAFTENFVGQWLGLRDIDFTEPSQLLYPEFDHMLKVSMIRETELFFAEVLEHDLSLTNFVVSDFTMLNGRLAKHYGISGIDGWEFRKVTLPPNSHRGGLLTMASVLKVTANGTTTSPVTRGAWILDRVMGTPPSPPPEGIAALEPDTRGSVTIRDQLAKHRKDASCASCHSKIDPPGFALESFDVIGGWRDHYRSTGNGKEVRVDGRRMHYLEGKKVDPSAVMADGQKFRDIDEFKQLLLHDKDQLARALTEKLLTYATGGLNAPGNRTEIEAIVQRVRDQNYGLRTLVHQIVKSKAFQRK